METVIKVHPSELNINLLNKIREFIGNKKNIDVTISLKEFNEEYTNSLNQSIEQAESSDKLVTLTMEEFSAYTPAKK